jgi:hypothetical protein
VIKGDVPAPEPCESTPSRIRSIGPALDCPAGSRDHPSPLAVLAAALLRSWFAITSTANTEFAPPNSRHKLLLWCTEGLSKQGAVVQLIKGWQLTGNSPFLFNRKGFRLCFPHKAASLRILPWARRPDGLNIALPYGRGGCATEKPPLRRGY